MLNPAIGGAFPGSGVRSPGAVDTRSTGQIYFSSHSVFFALMTAAFDPGAPVLTDNRLASMSSVSKFPFANSSKNISDIIMVIVLSGVDQNFLGERGTFDELGAGAHD
jgi:hypothetical protein